MACDGLLLKVPFDALDLASADEFTRWYREFLAPEGVTGPPDLVLDLGDVELVTAAGVRALTELDAELAARNRRLVLVGAASIVERVLAICGVAERWIVR